MTTYQLKKDSLNPRAVVGFLAGYFLLLRVSDKMVIARNLSTIVDKQPIKLLPTKQERTKLCRKTSSKDTAGPAWFNMPTAQLTPELEKDIKVLSMRAALDPKRHYKSLEKIGQMSGKERKKGENSGSLYVQVGTIVSDPTGFYTDRLTRKERAPTILDSLIKDTQSKTYLKKKFNELHQANQRGGRGIFRKAMVKKPWLRKRVNVN